MQALRDLGEHEIIRRLVAGLGTHADLRVGAGDDCAVTTLSGTGLDQLFTTDPLVEGIHFLPDTQPERIGHKAVGRVLSDIAAMGGDPQWILINVVAPLECAMERLEGIYAGMRVLCERFGAVMIGGDLAQGPCLELHVFGTGTLPSGSALLRSGAQVGDQILVTGQLGGSLSGWHLDFVPRVEEARFLRESGGVHAMMDLSDGLATDLRHILKASGVGALLEASRIPRNKSLDGALYDGEDFELLLTVAPDAVEDLLHCWSKRFDLPLTIVGTVESEAERLRLLPVEGGEPMVLERKAFVHFSSDSGCD